VLQARRLAAHLAVRASSSPSDGSHIGHVRHVFASDLRRAVDTAQAVVDAIAQHKMDTNQPAVSSGALRVVQCRELRERDFGLAEGKKFGAVPPGGLASLGAETREQMRARAEAFVRDCLVPVLLAEEGAEDGAGDGAVVVVAHGLILDALLRVLLAYFGPAELARLGDQRTVGWSNTGYVELIARVDASSSSAAAEADGVEVEGVRPQAAAAAASGDRTPPPQNLIPRISILVVGVNLQKHLEGLRKTRGGIGSAQFDKRQRTVDSFFAPAAKKARVEKRSEEAC
jgi:broad specificity phosphatase PhoE